MKPIITFIGLIAACTLPLFNIPMILHIIKRKSSKDLSLVWLFGVWTCILLMLPSVLISPDQVFKIFGILNLTLFSAVVVVACRYRK